MTKQTGYKPQGGESLPTKEQEGRSEMESGACYGYYGEGHGCTGEVQPVVHKSGWRFMNFYFEVKGLSGKQIFIEL